MDKEGVVCIYIYIYIYIYTYHTFFIHLSFFIVCVCVYIYIYTHTMEYYSAIKKNEVLPFAITWVDLEDIMLSEIVIQKKTNTI